MTLAIGFALVASLGLSAGTQSLADLARKTEEERAKAKTPAAKVITNDDLKPGRQPTETPAADPNASADLLKKKDAKTDKADKADKADKSDAKPAFSEQDEMYWRGRYKQLQAWYQENIKREADFGAQVQALTAQLAALGPDDSRRTGLTAERGRMEMEQHAALAAINEHRAAMAKMEEDGRKAGVPPEWFR